MRAWLLPLEQAGLIDVEEEFQQACFHITVYKNYVPGKPAPMPAMQATVVPTVMQTGPVQSLTKKTGRSSESQSSRSRNSPRLGSASRRRARLLRRSQPSPRESRARVSSVARDVNGF